MRFYFFIISLAFLFELSFSQEIEGIPCQVCGNQTFETSFATTSSSVTFSLSSSVNEVTVSPTSVTYTSSNTEDITINCQTTGPVEIIFDAGGANIVRSVQFYCTGLITVLHPPVSVVRGSEFELDVTLSPTAVIPVNLVVESLNSLITPGSERIIFGIEQSLANEIFFVPEANVGKAELLFRSRSLRDYNGPNCEALSIQINVQGSITSDLPGSLIGTTTTVPVTLTLHPPPTEMTTIQIDTNGNGDAPSEITVNARDEHVMFDLTVTEFAFNEACITFSGDYYQTQTDCFTIGGIFDSNLPSEINTHAVNAYSLIINPKAGVAGLNVNVDTTSNVLVDHIIAIPPGEDTELFRVNATEPGNGWIEFSADGYVTKRFDFTIIQVECDNNTQVINNAGTECLTCPMTNGIVCNNEGICVTSFFSNDKATCICNENYFGPQCEFNINNTNNLMIVDFNFVGEIFTTQLIPLTFSTLILIPPNLLQDGYTGNGIFYLQAYDEDSTFYGAINPNNNPPMVENSMVSIIHSGFNFDIISEFDNTAIHELLFPLEFTFEFDSDEISQMEFLQLKLYYWDPSSMEWVTAQSVCSQEFLLENYDLFELSLHISLCFTGQYQFFQISPNPAHTVQTNQYYPNQRFVYDDLNDYYSSTGIGGIRGVEPPQPYFTGKPVELPQQTSTSSETYSTSSTQTIDILTDMSFAPSSHYKLTPLDGESTSTSSSSSSGTIRLLNNSLFTITISLLVMFIF